MSRLRHFLFPYWWLAWAYKRQGIFQDYVVLRQGLVTAKLEDGRLTCPVPPDPTADKAVEWLYFVLSVLDAKASALMRLNGVMLAAATFLLGFFAKSGPLESMKESHSIVFWIAGLSSISIALCLLVVSIDWPFLGL